MSELVKKAMLIGIGALSLTREAAEKFASDLVGKGEMSEDEAKKLAHDMVDRGTKERKAVQAAIEKHVEKIMKETGVAMKTDIARMEARIADLEARLQSKSDAS